MYEFRLASNIIFEINHEKVMVLHYISINLQLTI